MYATVEEAISATVEATGYRSPTFEPKIQGGRAGIEIALDRRSKVLAVLGRYDERTQDVIIYWSLGYSFRSIGRALGLSDRTVRRVWEASYEQIARRLEELEVVRR